MHLSTIRRAAAPRADVARGIAALLLAAALAAPAAAQTGAPSSQEPNAQWRDTWGKAAAPHAAGMTSNKGFSATIHLVEQAEAERFVREWNDTPPDHAPTLTPAERTTRGRSIVLLILYAGCGAGAEGPTPCTATMDVKTFDPSGKLIMEELAVALARDIPAYPNIVQLSPITLQTDFEPSDPYGVYRYEVTLRNPARNANIALTDTIVLGAPPATP